MGQPNMEQNPPKSPHATASSEEDNLDYESEDDDDSRSNYSTNNQNSNISTLTNGSDRASGVGEGRLHGSGRHSAVSRGEETKRSHHNVLERKRRDLLKDSFTKLRDSVPTTQPKERVSRAEILKQAADFIQARVQQNARARAELEELIRKNQELEAKQKAPSNAPLGAAAVKVVAGVAPPAASLVTGTIITSSGPEEPPA